MASVVFWGLMWRDGRAGRQLLAKEQTVKRSWVRFPLSPLVVARHLQFEITNMRKFELYIAARGALSAHTRGVIRVLGVSGRL